MYQPDNQNGLQQINLLQSDYNALTSSGAIIPDLADPSPYSVVVTPGGISAFNSAVIRGPPGKYFPQ